MGGKDSGVHLGPQGDGGGGAGPGYRNGSGPGGKLQGGGHRGTLVDGRQEIAGKGIPGGGGIHRLDPVGGLEDRLALAVRIHYIFRCAESWIYIIPKTNTKIQIVYIITKMIMFTKLRKHMAIESTALIF